MCKQGSLKHVLLVLIVELVIEELEGERGLADAAAAQHDDLVEVALVRQGHVDHYGHDGGR